MTTPRLIGVRQKINRAKYHLNQLKAALEAWNGTEEEGNPLVIYKNPGRTWWDLSVKEVTPNNPNWALIVGDIIHNLRSALDHLVYQLAILHGQSTNFARETFFPISLDASSFSKARVKLESHIAPRALALIEELQPYKAADLVGKDPKASKLWIVSELDIIDKHRILIVTGKFFRITELNCFVNNGTPVVVPVDPAWHPLIDGAPLASVDFSSFALKDEDKMNVGARMEVQIFFNETGTEFDGLQPVEALQPCIRYISGVVELFEGQFFN
ncbi:MAG TPA: hypothetical protein VNU20_04825 [Candidatus Sulfotelmatobacter sp.]|nr:hypothetical protein [Candidatus Sulfotelmatobacter sp.]